MLSKKRLHAYFYLLIATIIWSFAGIVIKQTLTEINTFSFLTYRFFLSAVLAVILISTGKVKIPKKASLTIQIFFLGILGNVIGLSFLFMGLNHTTVLETSMIETMIPLISAVMGAILLNEIITGREKVGITIALVGSVITIVGPPFVQNQGNTSMELSHILGNVLILLFVFIDSYNFILTKKAINKGATGMQISNLSFISAFLVIAPIMLLTEGLDVFSNNLLSMSLMGHLGVWFMAIFSGTVGYALWNMGQKSIEVSEAAIFRYLIPVFATPLAIILLEEKIDLVFILGATIIITGVIIAELQPRRKYNQHLFGHKR